MKQHLTIATALALSLLVSAPACKKDKKEGDTAAETGDKKGGDTSAKTADGKGSSDKGSTAATGDVMSHFPADTEIVLSFNIASLTGSKMWKDYGEAAMASGAKELSEFKETCGFDPVTTIKSAHVGFNSNNSEEPVMIVNGFARGKLIDCAKKMAEKEGEKIELTEDGKFTIMVADGGEKTTAIAWLDDSTMLLVPNKNDKDYLQARMDGKDSVTGNAAFTALAGKAKQSAPIWFAGAFAEGSAAASNMGAMGPAPKGFYGSIGFNGGIEFDLGVNFADEKTATETLNMAKGMLPMAKGSMGPAGELVDKLKLATSGADMTAALKLTDGDVEKLKALAGPLLGGMGGL